MQKITSDTYVNCTDNAEKKGENIFNSLSYAAYSKYYEIQTPQVHKNSHYTIAQFIHACPISYLC